MTENQYSKSELLEQRTQAIDALAAAVQQYDTAVHLTDSAKQHLEDANAALLQAQRVYDKVRDHLNKLERKLTNAHS